MTEADLDRITAAHDAARDALAARLSAAVRAKVDDARAHAGRALTARLKATPDGRATARRAARSPSAQAAANRLDELLTWLCGPSSASLDGQLRDAREALYGLAFKLHHDLIPEEIRVMSTEPTQAALRFVRGFPLHNLDLRHEIGAEVEKAQRQLRAALHRASAADIPAREAENLLDAWARKAADSLARVTEGAVGDAARRCDGWAQRDLVRPEFREDG